MRKWIIVTTLAMCAVANAQVLNWWNYSQWERLPADAKVAYIVGAFDSLVGYFSDDLHAKMSAHYSKCVFDTRMSLTQLSERVAAFGQAHPELQGGTVQTVMVNYLISLCGKPPR